ncbi:MAG: substrate-binding domain-containing protein, partial [Verrucomicrobiae bacterium]|nr:substrate-binding domain-containing protein [Verrucomicrobiae bacterium]
ALKRRQYPYVILAGGDPSLGCEVNYDRPAAVRGAVLHLIEHGYRRIGFLGRMDASATSKFDCFRAALQEQGLPLDPATCSPCASLGEAQLAARRFLESPTIPEAVFVDHYDLAEILVRLTGYHRLRVPDDLAVMAYGTAHRGGVQPPLSLMEVPGLEMGREAAILLNRLIHGRGARSAPILLQAHLTLRRSCGCSGKPSSTTSSPLSEKEVFV